MHKLIERAHTERKSGDRGRRNYESAMSECGGKGRPPDKAFMQPRPPLVAMQLKMKI